MKRLRIKYEKGSELQYTGNLDMQKVWERTFRRAHLPLAYSQGFHPQPKIQQAAPLPLGFLSNCEILDVWFDIDEGTDFIFNKLVQTAQPGIKITEVLEIPVFSEALPNLVLAAEYKILMEGSENSSAILGGIQSIMKKENIFRERRGKNYDLRPLIETLSINQLEQTSIVMRLTCLPGATGRPEEVLEELEIDPGSVQITRTNLFLK